MTFAPQKKTSRKVSPDHARKTGSSYMDMNFPSSAQRRNYQSGDPDVLVRIDVLEGNLSRISQQQDALLPLMNMLEVAPSMAKNENVLRGLNKKGQDTEDRITRIENMVKNYQQNVENTIYRLNSAPKVVQADTSLLEKSLRDVSNQANKQAGSIKELELTVSQSQKAIETKANDSITNSSRALEYKLERQKGEFNGALNDLSRNIDLTFKKFEEAIKELYGQAEKFEEFTQTNGRQKIIDEVNDLITIKFQEQFDFFNEKYDRDIDNLYREFGILRCEMDLINDEKRQAKMNPHLQNLPKDPTPGEKKIKFNNIEQALNIHELDKFNKETTQRIMYELQAFDEKLDQMKEKFQQSKMKNYQDEQKMNEDWERFKIDMDIMNERYIGLKYQIEGAKKKYFFDMRRIEDKMEKINQIKREAQEELIANPKVKRTIPQELQVIDTFPEKIKGLMEVINKNLESTFTRLEILEEKIKENQELLKKKKSKY